MPMPIGITGKRVEIECVVPGSILSTKIVASPESSPRRTTCTSAADFAGSPSTAAARGYADAGTVHGGATPQKLADAAGGAKGEEVAARQPPGAWAGHEDDDGEKGDGGATPAELNGAAAGAEKAAGAQL